MFLFSTPANKEKFVHEYLYIEDTYYIPRQAPQEQKVEEDDVERGVIIIDLF